MLRNVCLGDYTNTFVDHIIDIFEVKEDMEVTEVNDDLSSKTEVVPTTAVAAAAEAEEMSTAAVATDIDFDALKTLADDGIDMSFLPSLQERLAASAMAQPTVQR